MKPKIAASNITSIGPIPNANIPAAIGAIAMSLKLFKDVSPKDTVAFPTIATTIA
jgi:hypothetical protein